jgi:hypothetical protein
MENLFAGRRDIVCFEAKEKEEITPETGEEGFCLRERNSKILIYFERCGNHHSSRIVELFVACCYLLERQAVHLY